MDCNPPGYSVHGILQARILEWVVMPCFRGSSWPRDQTRVSYDSCIDWQVVLYHLRHLGGGTSSDSASFKCFQGRGAHCFLWHLCQLWTALTLESAFLLIGLVKLKFASPPNDFVTLVHLHSILLPLVQFGPLSVRRSLSCMSNIAMSVLTGFSQEAASLQEIDNPRARFLSYQILREILVTVTCALADSLGFFFRKHHLLRFLLSLALINIS